MAIVNGIGLGLHIFYTLVYDFFHDDKVAIRHHGTVDLSLPLHATI